MDLENICTCTLISTKLRNANKGRCYKHLKILKDRLNRPDLVKEVLEGKDIEESKNDSGYHHDLDGYFENALGDYIKGKKILNLDIVEAFVSYIIDRKKDETDHHWEIYEYLFLSFVRTVSKNPYEKDLQKMAQYIESILHLQYYDI